MVEHVINLQNKYMCNMDEHLLYSDLPCARHASRHLSDAASGRQDSLIVARCILVWITTGTVHQVNKALEVIKRKFPVKRFPGLDYNRCLPDVPVLPADIMQVTLSVVSVQYISTVHSKQAQRTVFLCYIFMYTALL